MGCYLIGGQFVPRSPLLGAGSGAPNGGAFVADRTGSFV
jgi:hypothetical protein